MLNGPLGVNWMGGAVHRTTTHPSSWYGVSLQVQIILKTNLPLQICTPVLVCYTKIVRHPRRRADDVGKDPQRRELVPRKFTHLAGIAESVAKAAKLRRKEAEYCIFRLKAYKFVN